ncbi:serpentine type 7TM GPCR chemoreceptor srh domain-containing protein [Ditylenchus destructor]|uniref:Serpentine type 7TM GPCR chemoreceptor srh domain-containing protein n=1 Tax=Ditylenchus destructor TaxID=166010 RepID=A0AAD4QYA8_9BILA|nr:serpentine type 7TM GPCR chemoreceptor srh domain-containing protein [Ditylenchus destructor]
MFDEILVFNGTQLAEFNVFRLTFDIVALANTCLQLYNLAVIYVATPKNLLEYRFCLYLQTIFDLCFEFWYGVMLGPRITRYTYCLAFRGPLQFNNGFLGSSICMAVLFFFGSMIICAQHYSYIYRCLLVVSVTDKKLMRSFNKPTSRIIGVMLFALIAALVGFAAFSITQDFEEMRDLKKQYAPNTTWWCVDVDKHMVWVCIMAVLFVISQFVNLVGGIVVILAMKRVGARVTLDQATHRMQTQVTIVLLFQGMTPFFCIFVPLILVTYVAPVYRPYFYPGTDLVGQVEKVCIILVATFPLINAILTSFFIKPYRKFTQKLFRRAFRSVRHSLKRLVGQKSVVDSSLNVQQRDTTVSLTLQPQATGGIAEGSAPQRMFNSRGMIWKYLWIEANTTAMAKATSWFSAKVSM